MTKVIKLIVLLLVSCSSFLVNGQVVTIQTVLDTNKIELGDRIELKYVLEKSSDTKVVLPEFSDTLIISVEVLEPPVVDSSKLKNKKVQIEQNLLITSFDEGMHYIPPQPFVVSAASGVDTIYSKESYFEVVGVAIDTTNNIRDIAGLERAPIIFRDFLPLFILIGMALIVILIVYLIRLKQKKRGLIKAPEKPAEPAYIIALRELDRLKALKLWQQDQVKEHYTQLSIIVRGYIERQFNISALEESTTELMRDLKQSKLGEKMNLMQLDALLKESDLVKFAKGTPSPEDNLKQVEVAYSFVKNTKELFVEDDVLKDYQEKMDQLKNSYSFAAKIKNVDDLNDLEILSRLDAGARLVEYTYVISAIVKTFSLSSPIFLIKSGERKASGTWIYSAITMVMGWWGIPSGPSQSIKALKLNKAGGKQVKI